MKYIKILVPVLICFATASGVCQSQSFSYKRKVNVSHAGWNTIKLPPDIFAHCDGEFNDLRLYSIAGTDTTEVPYLLKKRTTQVNDRELELSAINKSLKGNVLFITFEMKGQKANLIKLDFAEPNYFAYVKVEGSDDKKEWFEITDRQRIFSIKNPNASFDYTDVNFPVAAYDYLRVSVTSETSLQFTRGTSRHLEIDTGKFEAISLTWHQKEHKKEHVTIVDVNFDNFRPISDLVIAVDDKSDYNRYCVIHTVHDSTKTEKGWIENYTQIGEGYLTSFRENRFDLMDVKTAKIRVVIHNLDNAPLSIKNVAAQGHTVELVADLKAGNTFLFYGKDFLTPPSYDLTYFEEKIPATTASATLGVEENISVPEGQVSALLENKAWLWAVMIVVIGLLGYFTLKMMKEKTEVSS
jgi:hypothetical protein